MTDVTICPPGKAKGLWKGKGGGVDTTIVNLSRRLDGTRCEVPNARAEYRKRKRHKSERSLAEDAPTGLWSLQVRQTNLARAARKGALVTGNSIPDLLSRVCKARAWGSAPYQRKASARLMCAEYDVCKRVMDDGKVRYYAALKA